jgi:hypothetical protein
VVVLPLVVALEVAADVEATVVDAEELVVDDPPAPPRPASFSGAVNSAPLHAKSRKAQHQHRWMFMKQAPCKRKLSMDSSAPRPTPQTPSGAPERAPPDDPFRTAQYR